MYPHALEPPFDHLYSTSLEFNSLPILAHNYHFSSFTEKNNKTSVKARRSHESAPLPNLPISATSLPPPPPPTYHLAPAKVITTHVSRHLASPCAIGIIFPLCFAKCTHLVLYLLSSRQEMGGGI